MTLEQLIIKVRSQYTGGPDMKEARQDVEKIDDRVQKLNRALNILSGAAIAAGAAGLKAFIGWDKTLTALAGKAGLTRQEFSRLYSDASGAISRATGAQRILVAEGLQRAHSLDSSSVSDNINLVKLASMLEAGGQARVNDAVEAAMAMQGQGMGKAPDILQKIYKGSQLGAGDVSDYFGSAKGIMGWTKMAGVAINEMISAISVLSASAKRLPEGETQYNAFLRGMMKPSKPAQEFFQERTGQDMSYLRDMLKGEGGLANTVEYLSKNFQDHEMPKILNEGVSAQFIKAMSDSLATLRGNTQAISQAPLEQPINIQGQENLKAFDVQWQRFQRIFNQIVTEFGEPIAAAIMPLLKALNGLGNTIIRLNASTNGVFMQVSALIAGMLALRLAIVTAAGAWRVARNFIRGGQKTIVMPPVAGAARSPVAPNIIAQTASETSKRTATSFGTMLASVFLGSTLGGMAPRVLPAILNVLKLLTNPIVALAALGVSLPAAIAYISRNSEETKNVVANRMARTGQIDHFSGGGSIQSMPPPGDVDVAYQQRDVAVAYMNNMRQQAMQNISELFQRLNQSIHSRMPQFVVTLDQKITGLLLKAIDIVGNVIDQIGSNLWGLITNPGATWKKIWANVQKTMALSDAAIFRTVAKMTGGLSPDSEGLHGMASTMMPGVANQGYIEMSPGNASAMGLESLPQPVMDSPNVNLMNMDLPTPNIPSPLIPKQPQLPPPPQPGDYKVFGSKPPWIPGTEMPSTVIVNVNKTNADPKEIGEAVDSGIKKAAKDAAWRSIEENSYHLLQTFESKVE